MKLNKRDIHRTLAFFYVGLILSFAFSGILNNHRNDWHLKTNYTYETKEFTIPVPVKKSNFNNKIKIAQMAKKWYKHSNFLGYRIKNMQLRAFYKDNTIVDINLENGFGTVEYRRKTPIIGHTIFLHKSSNGFWKIYSDIFAISLMIIAITGVMIPRGKNSFKKAGWKLILLGFIIPLIFLFLFA